MEEYVQFFFSFSAQAERRKSICVWPASLVGSIGENKEKSSRIVN